MLMLKRKPAPGRLYASPVEQDMNMLLLFKRISEWLKPMRVLGIVLVALTVIAPFSLVDIKWLILLLPIIQLILLLKYAPKYYPAGVFFILVNIAAFITTEFLKHTSLTPHPFEANIFIVVGIIETVAFVICLTIIHNHTFILFMSRLKEFVFENSKTVSEVEKSLFRYGTIFYYSVSMATGLCIYVLYLVLRIRVSGVSLYGFISDAISYPNTFRVLFELIPFVLIFSSTVGLIEYLNKKREYAINAGLIIISCLLALLLTRDGLWSMKPSTFSTTIARGAGEDTSSFPEEVKNWYPCARSKLDAFGEFEEEKLKIEYAYSGYTTNGFVESIRIAAGGEIVNKSVKNGEGKPAKGIWSLKYPNLFELSEPFQPQELFTVKYREVIRPNKNSKKDKSPLVTSQEYTIDSNIFLTQFLPGFDEFKKTNLFFNKYYPENEISVRVSFPPNVFISSEPKPAYSLTDKTGTEIMTYEKNEMEYRIFYTKPFARGQLFKILIPGYSIKNLAIICFIGFSVMIFELSLDILVPRFIKKLRPKKRQKTNTLKLFK